MPVAPPRVSVLMLTHNHAAYLRQAIASVQAQSLQAWELLIGEDGSSDDTGRIARSAALADPRIRVFDSPAGALGFHRNFARLLDAARAPYVAFLEGDDWWSEPCKLDLQLALLDQDSSLAFCGGRTRVIDQRSSPLQAAPEAWIAPAAGRRRLSLVDLIEAYSFHFSSVLMRRQAVALPAWIYGQYCLDRPLYLLAARQGDAGVIEAELSVYRLHGGGAWAPLTPLQKALRSDALFQAFYRHFPPLLAPALSPRAQPHSLELSGWGPAGTQAATGLAYSRHGSGGGSGAAIAPAAPPHGLGPGSQPRWSMI